MKRGQRNLERKRKESSAKRFKRKLHDEIQYRTNSEHFSTPTDSPSDRGSPGKQCTDYQHRNEQE